jgi:hypothetical protein
VLAFRWSGMPNLVKIDLFRETYVMFYKPGCPDKSVVGGFNCGERGSGP